MLHIHKEKEPKFLTDFKKKYPRKDYDSDEFSEYRSQLNSILVKEQKGLCAYCCGKITEEKSHNEHIEPRHPQGGVSKRSLDYTNIVASCNNSQTCGIKKDNKYDEKKFISPLSEECEDKFTYYPDGIIDGDDYTIGLLNLNSYELQNARKSIYKVLQNLDKDIIQQCYMNEDDEEYQAYYNVIKWYWKTYGNCSVECID